MDPLKINIIDKLYYWIYARPMWQIIIFSIVCIVLWAFLNYKFHHKKIWYVINVIIVVCILAAIIYLTLFNRTSSNRFGVYLSPIENFKRALLSKRVVESMHLNILLFFPLGLSLPFALPYRLKHKVIITIVACFILSLCIETLQGLLMLGDVEILDVVANILGAAIGCSSYLISKYIFFNKTRCK